MVDQFMSQMSTKRKKENITADHMKNVLKQNVVNDFHVLIIFFSFFMYHGVFGKNSAYAAPGGLLYLDYF